MNKKLLIVPVILGPYIYLKYSNKDTYLDAIRMFAYLNLIASGITIYEYLK